MSPSDLLEDIDAYNIAQKLKGNKNLTFYDAFTQYYLNGVKQAKEDYLSQYRDKDWKQIVASALTNRNVKKLISKGAEDILDNQGIDFDKSDFNNIITNTFFESVADQYKKFINEFYGGYRK